MYDVGNRPIHLFKRPYSSLNIQMEDGYTAEKTFGSLNEFIAYLYRSYNAETDSFWFDGILDVTGEDTTVEHYWGHREGEFAKNVYIHRKRWMFAEELNSDWLTVLNPENYKIQVLDIVRRKGAKKQGPIYRKEPIPGTSSRGRWYYNYDSKVKHTAWYRDEIARQKMDKDEYPKRHPTPHPKREDWNFYHKRSHRELKSWKNKKIKRQWMKNMPRHKERLVWK